MDTGYLMSLSYKIVQKIFDFRCHWPNDIFGQTSDDDIIAILNIYCASQADKRTGMLSFL